jgi:hypothetical protein
MKLRRKLLTSAISLGATVVRDASNVSPDDGLQRVTRRRLIRTNNIQIRNG